MDLTKRDFLSLPARGFLRRATMFLAESMGDSSLHSKEDRDKLPTNHFCSLFQALSRVLFLWPTNAHIRRLTGFLPRVY